MSKQSNQKYRKELDEKQSTSLYKKSSYDDEYDEDLDDYEEDIVDSYDDDYED